MTHSFTRRAGALAMVGFAAATVVACSPPSDDAATPGGIRLVGRRRRQDLDLRRGIRRHGRPGRRRQEGGRAQRHRPAAGLGQLRRGHQGASRRKYPEHQGHQRPARRAAAPTRSPTAQRLKGQSGAPDVFDLGAAVALANTAMFAPYKVATWEDIAADLKDADGLWVNDYGGYMSIGYDSAKVPGADHASPTCSSPPTRARSPSTATRPRPAPPSPACRWPRSPTAARSATSPRASTSSASSTRPATSCRSTRPRPPSSRARPRSSSTGTTSTPPRPPSCRPGR